MLKQRVVGRLTDTDAREVESIDNVGVHRAFLLLGGILISVRQTVSLRYLSSLDDGVLRDGPISARRYGSGRRRDAADERNGEIERGLGGG